MTKKIYVVDTSVYLADANSIYSFEENDIIIPFKVLEEIDKHKKRLDSVGSNARQIIRTLDSLRTRGNLHTGVLLNGVRGIVMAKGYDPDALPLDFEINDADNQIIATALTERKNNSNEKIVVVSNDINMRVKCDALGIPCEDYNASQIVQNPDQIYTGYSTHQLADELIDKFYEGEDIFIRPDEKDLFANQYLLLTSDIDSKKTALAKFVNYNTPIQRIHNSFSSYGAWGVVPRNKEQVFALDLLMNPKIPIVSLIGRAGSGKTLLSLATGLEQVLGEKNIYRHLIISRAIQPMGQDIGYLPGTIEEKMAPWVAPIQDNLRFLMGNDKETIQMYVDRGAIEIEALTYIRGRSIPKAFIIIDECQNLNIHELKTIVTRVGEGTKIVLIGDIEQIDNVYIDATTNGLTHAVEKFKEYNISGHVSLVKGERSDVATLASKVL